MEDFGPVGQSVGQSVSRPASQVSQSTGILHFKTNFSNPALLIVFQQGTNNIPSLLSPSPHTHNYLLTHLPYIHNSNAQPFIERELQELFSQPISLLIGPDFQESTF